MVPKTWDLQGDQYVKKSWKHDQEAKVHWDRSWKHNNTKRKIEKVKKTCNSMKYYVVFSSYKCGASLLWTTSFWLGLMCVLKLHHEKTIALVPRAKTFDCLFCMDNNQRKPLDAFIDFRIK